MTVLKVLECGPIALELSTDAIASSSGLDEWWSEVVSLPEELRGLDLRELTYENWMCTSQVSRLCRIGLVR